MKVHSMKIRTFCLAIVVSFAASAIWPSYASAACSKDLPAEECKALYGSYEKWVPITESGICGASDGGSVVLTGNDNIQKAYNYFLDNGFNNIHSAAIVANLMAESGVNPKSNQGGGGPGRGIAQWTESERWQTLLKFADEQGSDPYELGTQLAFMSYELKNSYQSTVTNLNAQSDVALSTTYFMGTGAYGTQYWNPDPTDDTATLAFVAQYGAVGGFENPGTPHLDKRIVNAKAVLSQYGGVSGSDAACGSAGSVDCSNPSSATASLSQLRQGVVCTAEAELALWKSGEMKPGTDFFKYIQNEGMRNVTTPWCAGFVSWVYKQSGYPVEPSGENLSSQAFKTLSAFEYHPVGSYTPVPGDVVVYTYDGSSGHVNIVVSVNEGANTMTVIGGNQDGPASGGGDSRVSEYTRSISSAESLAGFASPKEGE